MVASSNLLRRNDGEDGGALRDVNAGRVCTKSRKQLKVVAVWTAPQDLTTGVRRGTETTRVVFDSFLVKPVAAHDAA